MTDEAPAQGNGGATRVQDSSPIGPAKASGDVTLSAPKSLAPRRRVRSRLTDGRTLLPGVPAQSTWVRLFRDMYEVMLEHVGGADFASEPQRLSARRVAVLETELRFQEMKLAQIRAADGEPNPELIDLYSRVSNTQRRHLEALGYARVPRDCTPSLASYVAATNDTAST
jgi:hypothetical protein